MMLAKWSVGIELLLLDFFIYVLSESRLFRYLVHVGYRLVHDRRFLVEFAVVFFVFITLGIGLGLGLSLLTERLF